MVVEARYVTDPACPWSWAAEPAVRRLMWEFGDEVRWTFVMGGLARDFTQGYEGAAPGVGAAGDPYAGLVAEWLDVAGSSGMPLDPRLWLEGPIRTTYPACMAAVAAAQQGDDGGYRYLRALREGLLCFRRKLDTAEALVEEARGAGLDVARFRIDLESHGTVEAFGAHLEEARDVPEEARAAGQAQPAPGGRERVPFPTVAFAGPDGVRHRVIGPAPYEAYAAAARAAGALPVREGPPGVLDALARFGRMALVEVEQVCGLPRPRAAAELWNLALEWRVRPVAVLTGELWELA